MAGQLHDIRLREGGFAEPTKAVWKEPSGALAVSAPSIGAPGAAASMAETYAWNSVK